MVRILTIYNCGTASNRDDGTSTEKGAAGELIASLYDRTTAEDVHDYGRLDLQNYNYKIIHDGPGSQPGKFGKWEVDKQGVRRFVERDASASKAKIPGLAERQDVANPQWVRKYAQLVAGTIKGSGWEYNVADAVHVVASLKHKPDVINMTGWSRGGITCHMMAHAFQDTFPEIRVNIFAVDPVPGGRHASHTEKQLNIPPNVAHYCAVLAKHDKKLGFKAAVVPGVDSHVQRRQFFLMPGIHDTVVSGATGLLGVAVLVEHLAAGFLAAHGTPLSKTIHLSPIEVCENYAIVKKNEEAYAGLAAKSGIVNKLLSLGGLAPARKNLKGGVQPGMAQDLRDAYFVNEHHERVFKRLYPMIYKATFVDIPSGNPIPASELANLKLALETMQVTGRNSFAALEETGLADYVKAHKPSAVPTLGS